MSAWIENVGRVEMGTYSAGFLFLPRIEALCNLGPPIRHFLKAAMDDWAASYTKHAEK